MSKNHYINLEKDDVLFVNNEKGDARLFVFDDEGFQKVMTVVEDSNYKVKTWKQIKDIVDGLDVDDVKRIALDVDDEYLDETNISIDIELIKDYGKDYN